MQIRLYQWQVNRLKKSGCGSKILQTAYERYKQGDFVNVAQCKEKEINTPNVPQLTLAPFAIRNRFDVTDSEMRNILTMHFDNPDKALLDKQNKEISRLDKEIAEMMKLYTMPFILE